MPNINRKNIDRKTNKPNPERTGGMRPDIILNRAEQIRRDDDIIRTAKRTLYDIDYAIKSYIENEIRPQIVDQEQNLVVPVIFANGEKWDNVRRLGYIRDEKGMLQSPVIMLKRNSVTERDSVRGLDVNHVLSENVRIYKTKYNERNSYLDQLFPIPINQPQPSEKVFIADIPKYVNIEYEMMLWCDFTEQMNNLVDQIMPYSRFAWGNEANRFSTSLGQVSFETVNTIGEDRLVRATIPLTVLGTLLSEQEVRRSTLRKAYSVKKVTFETIVTFDDIFNSTTVPNLILQNGGSIQIDDNIYLKITPEIMNYLTNITEQQATYVSATTVTINAAAATNPITSGTATKNEFDVYINGQYADKITYTWTPTTSATQTIVFDTAELGFDILSTDVIIVKGRWA
jgi:glutaredoxin